MRKKIATIIITYKFPKEKLRKLLSSLERIGLSKKTIFVKDNTNNNIGYAGGINKIIKSKLKNFDYFLILNPDIQIKNNFVKPLVSILDKNQADIVGPMIFTDNGKVWGTGGIIDKKRYSASMSIKILKHLTFVDFVLGTAFMVRKDVFEKIGLLDEDYFLYYDEVDFCMRARKSGFRLAMSPESSIYHYGSFSVGKDSNAMLYYMARSHMYFLEKYAPLRIKIRELIRFPRTIWQARKSKYEVLGIIDYFLRKKGRNDGIFVKADKDYK